MSDSQFNYCISLHVFRAMIAQKRGESYSDYLDRQYKLLKIVGIDQQLKNDYVKEIRDKCKYIGENGWAISPFWEPKPNESWFNTWYLIIQNDSPDKIFSYFREDNYSLLNHLIAYTRFEVNSYDWFQEAEYLFSNRQYTGCAMILTAILESSIRKCPIAAWRQSVSIFMNDAIVKNIEDIYEDIFNNSILGPFERYIETILLLPSINGYISMYFNSGKRFEAIDKNTQTLQLDQNNEPYYLERNWLMHGLTQRKISEVDCVKLFNVICSFHYVLHTLFETDYRQ